MSSEDGPAKLRTISLSVSDQSQLPSLRYWLRGQQDVEVTVTPGTPGRGEQGAIDVLTLIASSGSLIAAIKILPEFIRSRRSHFRIEITANGEQLSLIASNVATNIDEVMPILERLLND